MRRVSSMRMRSARSPTRWSEGAGPSDRQAVAAMSSVTCAKLERRFQECAEVRRECGEAAGRVDGDERGECRRETDS